MSAHSGTNVTRVDSICRYRKLIETARELFVEKGYEGTSLNQLVARAGGSKSSIYAYFKNKEGLFRAVMDDMMEGLLSPLETQPEDFEDFEQRLITVASRTLEVLTSPMGIGLIRLVHSEASRQPQLGENYFANGPDRAITELAHTLRSEAKLGHLAIDNPKKVARMFWGMLLYWPISEALCGVTEPMSKRQRMHYVRYVIREFMTRFATK